MGRPPRRMRTDPPGARGPRRVRRRAAAGALAACCAGLAGCSAAPPARASGPVVLGGGDPARLAALEVRLPALEALRLAVLDGDDEVAWGVLERLRAQGIEPEVEELLVGYERILVGRRLVRQVELALERTEGKGVEGGEEHLVLVASQSGSEPLTLRLPPADLKRLTVALSPTGVETRRFSRHLTHALEDLTLDPGEVRRVELLTASLDPGGALAVRERWRLVPRAGEIVQDGVAYPAQALGSVSVDGRALAPYLPGEALPPEELVAYVQRQEVFLPGALERAVRIDPARREEALDLLTDVVVALAQHAPERLVAIEPALRWLTHRGDTGTDWARWFSARRDLQRAPVERAVLDLPLRRDGTPRSGGVDEAQERAGGVVLREDPR